MSDASVRLDVTDGIATITIDRPDVRNALTEDVTRGLSAALDDLDAREDVVRCLVVEGSGGAFSAGGDINAMLEGIAEDVPLAERVRHIVDVTGRVIARLYRYPLPTIAKIDGPAVGAGANLALACDVQLASEDASIGFVFRQVGLAIDAGTSYLLPRMVGENTAKRLVYTGEIVGAREAADLGLFTAVHPADEFEDAVDAFIEPIATGPTVALRASKASLLQGLNQTIEDAIEDEAAAQAAVYATEDHREGAEAFMDDRAPAFEGK